MLGKLMHLVGGDAFVSTMYTSAAGAYNMVLVHDMIPVNAWWVGIGVHGLLNLGGLVCDSCRRCLIGT